MALTFADTHNMIAYLTKSDASEGFDQILDFLNASTIQYALTINPNIYVPCIKQFWSSVSVKKMNDVVRLQALIDRKKVLITEDTVRQALCLDDAESRKFNFSKYIFDSHVRNIDSSSKFYMYPRFLQLMIRAQISDLSSHTAKYSSPARTQKVFANIRRVGKGFSRVETLLFEGMLVPQQAANDVANVAVDDIDDVVAEDAAEPTLPSPTPTNTKPPPQELSFTSQVAPTPPPSSIAPPSSPLQQPQPSQPTTISMELLNTLLKTCTTLTKRIENLEQDKIAQALEITKLKQRVRRLEKRNKVKARTDQRLKKVRTDQRIKSATDTVMDDQEDASKQGRKIAELDAYEDVILEDAAAELEKDTKVAKDADKGKSSEQQAVKKQKLDEKVEELKKHLQIVLNDEDDVYIEATPLALKMLNNVRLEVEEESEVSLELLRFVIRQPQEGYIPKYSLDTSSIMIKLVKQEET
nr:hypothetical protein [Tanacetum cinerariifolium]